jgi:DUF1707 SHOCT-like domain
VPRRPSEATPSTRVGDAERAEAQRTLQHHLDAGRLQVAEFVERFGSAADAVTAAEIAALFADLPAPHPTLPGPPPEHGRRILVIVGGVAVLLLVGLLGFVIGRGRTAPAPSSGIVAAATPSLAPGTSPTAPAAVPTGRGGNGPEALPDTATVRRTTGPGTITLYPSDGVDLDDLTSPTWNAGTGCCGRDVLFGSDAGRVFLDGGHALVTGPLGFATCLHETAYTDAAVEPRSLLPGQTICVRTNDHRLALVTIVEASEQVVEFGATVWDPPL